LILSNCKIEEHINSTFNQSIKRENKYIIIKIMNKLIHKLNRKETVRQYKLKINQKIRDLGCKKAENVFYFCILITECNGTFI
jgi:hypothetical protein